MKPVYKLVFAVLQELPGKYINSLRMEDRWQLRKVQQEFF